jgi:hypothetical protein
LKISQTRLIQILQTRYQEIIRLNPNEAGPYLHLVVARLSGKTKIDIRMEKNHKRSHFHATCPDTCDISVDIATIEILAGECSGATWKEIRSWAFLNRKELALLWHRLNHSEQQTFNLEG